MGLVDLVLSDHMGSMHAGALPYLPSFPVTPDDFQKLIKARADGFTGMYGRLGIPADAVTIAKGLNPAGAAGSVAVAGALPTSVTLPSVPPVPGIPVMPTIPAMPALPNPSVPTFGPQNLMAPVLSSVTKILTGAVPSLPSKLVLPAPPTVPEGLYPSEARKLAILPQVSQNYLKGVLANKTIPDYMKTAIKDSMLKIVPDPNPDVKSTLAQIESMPDLSGSNAPPLETKYSFPTVCDPGVAAWVQAALNSVADRIKALVGPIFDTFKNLTDPRKIFEEAAKLIARLTAYPAVEPMLIVQKFLEDIRKAVPDMVSKVDNQISAAKEYASTKITAAQGKFQEQAQKAAREMQKINKEVSDQIAKGQNEVSNVQARAQAKLDKIKADTQRSVDDVQQEIQKRVDEYSKRVTDAVGWVQKWIDEITGFAQFIMSIPALVIKAAVDWLLEQLRDPINFVRKVAGGLSGMVEAIKDIVPKAVRKLGEAMGMGSKTPDMKIPPQVAIVVSTTKQAMKIVETVVVYISNPGKLIGMCTELATAPCSNSALS